MSVYVVKRPAAKGSRWHVRYRAGRYGSTVHLGSFALEREALAVKERARSLELAGITPSRTSLQGIAGDGQLLADACERWLKTRVDVAERTLINHRQAVAMIKDRWPRTVADSLRKADVQDWVAQMTTMYAPGTVKLRLGTLQQILDWLDIDPNPARRVRRPRLGERRKEIPTEAALGRVREALPARYHALWDVLLYGGLRISEALELEWDDVDEARGQLTANGRKTGNGGERPRSVAVLEGQPDWLPTRPEGARGTDRVFAFGDHGPHTVWLAVSQTAERLGVKCSPHTLRHAHASILLRDGLLDPARAAERLGQSVATYLSTYTHVIYRD